MDNIYINNKINILMTYNKLNSILKTNTEIHYISDNDLYLEENNINPNQKINDGYEFILFEYTTNMIETLKLLKQNNIDYIIYHDTDDLQFIII
jgi:tRNA G46 methylase TrmB